MIVLPTSFCPSVGYLSLIAASGDEGVRIDTVEQYRKQTLRNRALFMTASGIAKFTIPVAKYGCPAPSVSGILLSEHGDWRRKLEHALRSGYGTAPFWDHYEEQIKERIYDTSATTLTAYNSAWLQWMMEKWHLSEKAFSEKRGEDRRYDLEVLTEMQIKRYWQVFESKYGFTPGLSALDLLLCEGPYAVVYLQELGARILR